MKQPAAIWIDTGTTKLQNMHSLCPPFLGTGLSSEKTAERKAYKWWSNTPRKGGAGRVRDADFELEEVHILWASQVVLVVRNQPVNAGDGRGVGLILGLGKSPGGGRGNPLQYSCLENSHSQRSLTGYSPWGHKELDTTEAI